MHRGGHRGRGRGGGVRPKTTEAQEKSTPETKPDVKPDEAKPKSELAAPKTAPDRKHGAFHGPPAGHDHTTMSRIPQQMAFTARVTLHMWIPAEEVDVAQRQARVPANPVQFLALTRPSSSSSSDWQPVQLSGEANAVFALADKIAAVVDDVDDSVLELRMVQERMDTFAKEETILAKTAGAFTGTRIFVPPVGSSDAITIEGNLSGVRSAFGLIMEPFIKIASHNKTEEFAIPGELIGPVVGTKGKSLHEIMVDCGCRIDVTPKYPDDGFTEVGAVKTKSATEAKADSEDDAAEPTAVDAPAATTKAATKRRADSAAVVLQGPLDSVLLARAVIDGLHKALPSKAPMRLQTAFDMARTIAANHGQMLPVPPPAKDHTTAHTGKLINVYRPVSELVAVRYGPDGVIVPAASVPSVSDSKPEAKPASRAATESRPPVPAGPIPAHPPAPASFAAAVSGISHTTPAAKAGTAMSGAGEVTASPAAPPKKAFVSTRGGASATAARGGRGRGGRGGFSNGVVKPEALNPEVSAAKAPAPDGPSSASKRGRGGRAAGPPIATLPMVSKEEKDSGKQAAAPVARGGARGGGARGRTGHAERPVGPPAPESKVAPASS